MARIWDNLIQKNVFEVEKCENVVKHLFSNSQLPTPKDEQGAFLQKSPTLSALKKYSGKILFRAFLFEEIENLLKCFNVGRGFSDEAVQEFILHVETEYYYLNIDEVKLFFNKVKTGKFGVGYDRLDLPTLCEFLRKYDDNRTIATVASSESGKGVAPCKSEKMPGEVKKLLEKLLEKTEKKQKVLTLSEFSEQENIIKNHAFLVTNGLTNESFLKYANEKYKEFYGI